MDPVADDEEDNQIWWIPPPTSSSCHAASAAPIAALLHPSCHLRSAHCHGRQRGWRERGGDTRGGVCVRERGGGDSGTGSVCVCERDMGCGALDVRNGDPSTVGFQRYMVI